LSLALGKPEEVLSTHGPAGLKSVQDQLLKLLAQGYIAI